MKIIIRFILLILLPLSVASCDKQLEEDLFFSLNLKIEDENGNDLTEDVLNRHINSFIKRDGSTIPYFNYEDSFSQNYSLVSGYELYNGYIPLCDVIHQISSFYIKLYDNDVKSVNLIFHYNAKKESVKWEFEGEMIPQKSKLETYVTLIRHDNGTYSLKH